MKMASVRRGWGVGGAARVMMALVVGAVCTGSALAQETDPRIYPDTGRDRRVWPPDVLFDYQHIRLEVDIPDMARAAFKGKATLTCAPVGDTRKVVELDAGKGLTFSRVLVNGAPAEFAHDKTKATLTIQLGRSVPIGEVVTLVMEYVAVRPGGNGDGLTFSDDDTRTPEVDFMCHAQGQPQNNHLWFPCHDFPNERLSSEVIVTVPAPYVAVSNGALLSVTHTPVAVGSTPEVLEDVEPNEISKDAITETFPAERITYHWNQLLPHPSYLITLVVSRFDVVNVGGADSARPGLWIPVYGALGSGEALKKLFANTPAMIAYYEKLFQTPFPWDKYAQVLCRDFSAGAMENTSVVTFASQLARGRRTGAIDEIISHELTHHWFGDLITCRSWEHLWLNEGWATMGEALWAEHERGEEGYHAAILSNFSSERMMSRSRSAPRRAGMVTNRYNSPDQRFTSPDNVYQKGGAILAMLRHRLGDEAFFRGTAAYIHAFAFKEAETDDFRLALEQASGQSLERFFDQWCKRPGHPDLELEYAWVPGESGDSGTLEVTVSQKQKIDADNPAYAFELPLFVRSDGAAPVDTGEDGPTSKIANADKAASTATGEWVFVVMDTRETKASFPLKRRPTKIEIDPGLTVLSRTRVKQELSRTIEQLEDGSTLYVRYQAACMLEESDDPRAVAALARACGDGMLAKAMGVWPMDVSQANVGKPASAAGR